MSKLKIPDEVLNSIYQAVDQRIGWTSHAEDAINIAAPLIVATELRRLAKEQLKTHDDISCMSLLQRADELDPQGLIKE